MSSIPPLDPTAEQFEALVAALTQHGEIRKVEWTDDGITVSFFRKPSPIDERNTDEPVRKLGEVSAEERAWMEEIEFAHAR